MRSIPLSLKNRISANQFMKKCIWPECFLWPEWEHSYLYGNRQINEQWAIVPVCTYHHRGAGLNKNFNRWVAINRATPADFSKYPKKDWQMEKRKLDEQFKELNIKNILRLDSYKVLD